MPKRILHVVTNVGHFADESHLTGLWLSELTHAWQVFEDAGFEQAIVSPSGGASVIEPRSLVLPPTDKTTKAWLRDPERMALLATTLSPDQVDSAEFDAIYFAGGHGAMYDFPENEGLQRITREIWERGGVVSAVCHGYCGLLNIRLSDGSLLVAGRKLTGYSWAEEVLALVGKLVPYNVEEEMKERGAGYEKAKLPMQRHIVTDGTLVTGQNPASAKATARAVAALL